MQSQNLQNQSSIQSNEQAYIKAQANEAVNTLWKFETITNFQLHKLDCIQNVLQALLFEKINVRTYSKKRPLHTDADAIAHAMELCEDLRADFFEEAYQLSANNELFNIDAALTNLQEADISNIPTSN